MTVHYTNKACKDLESMTHNNLRRVVEGGPTAAIALDGRAGPEQPRPGCTSSE